MAKIALRLPARRKIAAFVVAFAAAFAIVAVLVLVRLALAPGTRVRWVQVGLLLEAGSAAGRQRLAMVEGLWMTLVY